MAQPMKINVTVDITTDEQLKEQAVAAAQTIINTAIAKVFPPGGVVHKAEPGEPIIRQGWNMKNISDPPPPIKCPECGGLNGAHAVSCMTDALNDRDKKITALHERVRILTREIAKYQEAVKKREETIQDLQKQVDQLQQGDRVPLARRFAEWLDKGNGREDGYFQDDLNNFIASLPNAS